MAKIVLVEDDDDIREIVAYALQGAGFEVLGLPSGEGLFATPPPDLIVLDIMLPEDDGLTILKKIRQNQHFNNTPVIMLTAKSSEYDKVKGLDLGADDYITKPFGVMELISRIKALLRRASNVPDLLTHEKIALDHNKRKVTVDNNAVSLTFKEYELLHYLMSNVGLVLSRDKIIGVVWGYDFEGESRTVDMHIKFLRQKLGMCGEHIKTVRGVGYKLGD
ncbi:MAG: response regulator transcription factor [Defluviitaleaceae bacterium]|nr:response regulator transcription factor [Defluviitaleaceae bacterium]